MKVQRQSQLNRVVFISVLSLLFIFTCHKNEPSRLPNDVRWVTNSNEYKSLCNQVYNMAWNQLSAQIKSNPTITPAIIMDLDETILDNSKYQIMLSEKKQSYNPQSWDVWVKKIEADLVPGSYEFLQKVRQYNVQLIFISNRMHARLEETKKNMDILGILDKSDIFLLRKDKADKKEVRRDEVFNLTGRMKGTGPLHVIAYFGDAMGDFHNKNLKNFGINQFMLPNPMYGKW